MCFDVLQHLLNEAVSSKYIACQSPISGEGELKRLCKFCSTPFEDNLDKIALTHSVQCGLPS